MKRTYYFAAWTNSDCLVGCDHQHKTVTSAVACISSVGGYVVAVTKGRLRELNDTEEAEFQRVMYGSEQQREKATRALDAIRLALLESLTQAARLHGAIMDSEVAELFKAVQGEPGEPVPTVDGADLKAMWAQTQELKARHGGAAIGIGAEVRKQVCSPGADVRAVSYRCSMLGSEVLNGVFPSR